MPYPSPFSHRYPVRESELGLVVPVPELPIPQPHPDIAKYAELKDIGIHLLRAWGMYEKKCGIQLCTHTISDMFQEHGKNCANPECALGFMLRYLRKAVAD